jgi:CRISPR/Cas system endoribonuclease Cas6 (RAMP superfamily)
MAMVLATPEPVIDDDVFEEVDKFEKQGDWTEERHNILEKLSMEEIAAEILQGQAANPERYLTPEELQKKIFQTQETPMTTGRRAKMVGV